MNEPAISLSVLGPSRSSHANMQRPGTVKWSDGASKMVAHIPFYLLGEQEGLELFILSVFYPQKKREKENYKPPSAANHPSSF